jgi:hypothetical protein
MVFCYILWTFGIVRGYLVYFPVLVFCTMKNLATLLKNRSFLWKSQRALSCESSINKSSARFKLFHKTNKIFVCVKRTGISDEQPTSDNLLIQSNV